MPLNRSMAALLALGLMIAAPVRAEDLQWVRSAAVSPRGPSAILPPAPVVPGGTARATKVRLSLGGARLRVRFSNEFGTTPLRIAAATVSGAGASPSARPLTFGGSTSIVVPPGAPALSDPVDLAVPALAELTVGFTLQDESAEDIPVLTGIDLVASAPTRGVVAIGDSITAGNVTAGSWPAALAARLQAAPGDLGPVAVSNAGIGGNRVLSDGLGVSALARFDRDVLAVPGVTHVIVLEGINDLGYPGAVSRGRSLGAAGSLASPQDFIQAFRQLIARAHSRGLRIYGATIMPFAGFTGINMVTGYYSPAKDKVRQQVNAWIRESGAFDGVIDFDRTMRDPAAPLKLRADLTDDGLHPNAAGNKVMAESIDLALLQ